MITIAYPQALYLLLLLPVAALLFIWARYSRKRRLARYGRPTVIERLMPDASKYTPWIKISITLIAMAAIIFMLSRPLATGNQEIKTEEKTSRGIEVMICLDVSRSMLASSTNDEQGIDRLQRAKHVLEKLVDKMNDDKVGLIVFAGDAYTQLPITSDYISAKMFINSISTEMVPTQGTAIGAAIEMAMNSFSPDDKFQKAIVIITDGENFEDDAAAMARKAADAGIQVDVVGIGGDKPMPVPVSDTARDQYLVDNNGQPAMTKVDAENAEKIAKAGKGIYVNGSSSSAVLDIDEQLNTLAKTEFVRKSSTPQAEQFPVFAWIALILLIIDTFIPERKISWLRNYSFFTPKETVK